MVYLNQTELAEQSRAFWSLQALYNDAKKEKKRRQVSKSLIFSRGSNSARERLKTIWAEEEMEETTGRQEADESGAARDEIDVNLAFINWTKVINWDSNMSNRESKFTQRMSAKLVGNLSICRDCWLRLWIDGL